MERRMKRIFEVDNNSIYRLLKKLVDEVAGIKEVITEATKKSEQALTKLDFLPHARPGVTDEPPVPVKRKRGRPAGNKKNG